MKFISCLGVPDGTKWAIILEKFFVHPKTMNDNQNVNAKENEIERWAVGVNVKGVRAIIFIVMQTKKTLVSIIALNFFSFGDIREEISLPKKLEIELVDKDFLVIIGVFRLEKRTTKGRRQGAQANPI